MIHKPPPIIVINSFGAKQKPVRIDGGQGTSYRSGNIVFKPVDSLVKANWEAEVMMTIEEDGFRVARPVKTSNNKWMSEGWCAWSYISGKATKSRWEDKLKVSKKYHKALSNLPKPDFLDKETHPHAKADKMVWGEVPLVYTRTLYPIISRLQKLMQPIKTVDQVIHGDMAGNILFDPKRHPGIIDLSPYWHPVEYVDATIVIESMVWEGAPKSLLTELKNTFYMNQLIIRAVTWLIKSSEEFDLLYGSDNLAYKVKKYNEFVDVFLERIS